MAVKGNVISCDECGRQVSMPMELEPDGKRSLGGVAQTERVGQGDRARDRGGGVMGRFDQLWPGSAKS